MQLTPRLDLIILQGPANAPGKFRQVAKFAALQLNLTFPQDLANAPGKFLQVAKFVALRLNLSFPQGLANAPGKFRQVVKFAALQLNLSFPQGSANAPEKFRQVAKFAALQLNLSFPQGLANAPKQAKCPLFPVLPGQFLRLQAFSAFWSGPDRISRRADAGLSAPLGDHPSKTAAVPGRAWSPPGCAATEWPWYPPGRAGRDADQSAAARPCA